MAAFAQKSVQFGSDDQIAGWMRMTEGFKGHVKRNSHRQRLLG
jgi:hypothetical protein